MSALKRLSPQLVGLLVVALAIALRLPLLNGSLWLDEAAQLLESIRPLSQQLDIAKDFQPPLLHIVIHYAAQLSRAEWWVRTIGALIPGVIAVYLTFRTGRELFSDRAGLVAALLLATNSFHIFYSQELRPYALAALWVSVSWWCLLRWTAQYAGPPAGASKTKPRKDGWWIGFTLSTIVGLYSMYLYPFAFAAQLIWIWMWRPTFRSAMITATLASAIAFLPWLPYFRQQLAIGTSWQATVPGWAQVVSIPQLKAMPLVLGKMLYGVLPLDAAPLQALIGVVGGGILAWSGGVVYKLQARKAWFKKNPQVMAVVLWLVVPLLAAWLVSFVVPVVRPKRLLFLFPAFYLLIGWMVHELTAQRKKLIQQIGWLLAGTLLIINLIGTAAYYTQPRLQRENWRGLISEIQDGYSPHSTIVIMAFDEPFAPWRYYAGNTYQVITTQDLYVDAQVDLRDQFRPINEARIVLVFDYLRDITDPDDNVVETVRSYGFEEVDVIDYHNIGFIRVFAKPGDLISSTNRG